MSTSAAPKRWLDALPEGDALRGSLQAARRDLPTSDALEGVYSHVVAVAGGAGGGGVEGGVDPTTTAGDVTTGAAASGGATSIAAASRVAGGKALTHAASGAIAKGLVLGLFGVASVGTAWWIARDTDQRVVEARPQPVAAPTAPRAADPAPSPAPLAPAPTIAASAAPLASSPGTLDQDPEEEMALLREASGLISSNPGRALALVDEAERRFARGALAQEREAIRVQALIAAGRRDEALQRARALLARTPTSAHRPRLEQLLPELAMP